MIYIAKFDGVRIIDEGVNETPFVIGSDGNSDCTEFMKALGIENPVPWSKRIFNGETFLTVSWDLVLKGQELGAMLVTLKHFYSRVEIKKTGNGNGTEESKD
jgi:hypothetical protein